jgi:hypothetical protein
MSLSHQCSRYILDQERSSKLSLLSIVGYPRVNLFILCIWAGLSLGCSEANIIDSHPVPYDLEPIAESPGKSDGLSDQFDPEWLMSDLFFLNTSALTAEHLQYFLSATPYGIRSWLADLKVGREPASQVIIRIAHERGVNPLLLLTRMQVEQSLVSRSDQPAQRVQDAALGCGCHDGERCADRFKGFEKQLICAADTLRTLFTKSRRGEGAWIAGRVKNTLDPLEIRPANHVTAAMYAYTPWVLKGRGGNWLAWNIMRKFTRFLKEQDMLGELDEFDLAQSPALGDEPRLDWSEEELSKCLYQSGRAFVGDPCGCQRDCDFWSGRTQGFCHDAGFCALPCEGGCPDVLGRAQTFCIEDPHESSAGICVPKASEYNGHCADLPFTIDDERSRFIGDSYSVHKTAEVCAPNLP